jgi:DNA-binding MarR family transcriptional regulator
MSAQQAMQRACGPRAWSTLALLRASASCSQAELARALAIGQPSVSVLLADLEQLGLVHRVRLEQGPRGRPTERWAAVDPRTRQLLQLGQELMAQQAGS